MVCFLNWHFFELQSDDFHLHMVSGLLGIDKGQLKKWLCNRKIVATGEVYIVPLNTSQVCNS